MIGEERLEGVGRSEREEKCGEKVGKKKTRKRRDVSASGGEEEENRKSKARGSRKGGEAEEEEGRRIKRRGGGEKRAEEDVKAKQWQRRHPSVLTVCARLIALKDTVAAWGHTASGKFYSYTFLGNSGCSYFVENAPRHFEYSVS